MDIEISDSVARSMLADIGSASRGKNMVLALVSGALIAQNEARILVPVLTGNLRRSIHVGGHKDKAPGSDDAPDVQGPKISRNNVEVTVGTNVEYARPVELGSENRRPKPYLRPAADENRRAIEREIEDAFLELAGLD